MKRCWRRRSYKRLDKANYNKKKSKITRLGGNNNRRSWQMKPLLRLRLKIISPIKLFVKFHDAYINMMIRLTCTKNVGVLGGKRISKVGNVPIFTSSSSYEEFDSRLVLETYKRLAASNKFKKPMRWLSFHFPSDQLLFFSSFSFSPFV